MTGAYDAIDDRLAVGEIVILDGGTGTELERQGVPMDPNSWCGPTTLDNLDALEAVHRSYIDAGAEVITANTYASAPINLAAAGLAHLSDELSRTAVDVALRARSAAGRADVAVGGSLSHTLPMVTGSDRPVGDPPIAEIAASAAAMAGSLAATDIDLVLLEMMYHPDRMPSAFDGAASIGVPVWAGFSARRGADGSVLAYHETRDVPFEEVVEILDDYEIAVAGIMHTSADITGDALDILRDRFDGPLSVYPDSGYFTMPNWQLDPAMTPDRFAAFVDGWLEQGVQVVGGCCGLTPDHIAAIAGRSR